MAAMRGLLLKPSSVSKPFLLPLKCRRNPQICLLSSMMIKNSTTTTTFIKCSNGSSRGSAALIRVQCVLNKSNKNWFKEEEEEEKNTFGKVMLKVVNALEKLVDAILIWVILKPNPTFNLGLWLAFDLCMAIWSISSQYSRIRKWGGIEVTLGPMLCSVFVFFAVVFGLGKKRKKITLEWTPSSSKWGNVFGFGQERKMTLEWTVDHAKENGDHLKRQAGVIEEMVNAAVVDSAFGSKDTAAQCPEAGSKKRAAHEQQVPARARK